MSKSAVTMVRPLVIPNGSNASNVLSASEHYGDGALISIQSPATLDALTFSIEGSQDGTTFAAIQTGSPLADLPVPAVNKAATYESLLAFKYIRIKASGNVAADRTFLVTKHYTA